MAENRCLETRGVWPYPLRVAPRVGGRYRCLLARHLSGAVDPHVIAET